MATREDEAKPRMELLRDADREHAWMLLVDGTPQSHVDLADPRYLEFEYMRRLGHVVDLAAEPGAPVGVFHLGAGALTLARYAAATRPGSDQRAVDSDADLIELVRRDLPWSKRARLRVGTADAREWLEARRTGSADVVVADVFAGARTPGHLTSVEFAAEAARTLRVGGVYAANIGDGHTLSHARAQVSTLREVFAHVVLIAEPSVLRGRRFGNLVVVAAQHELPSEELARHAHRDPSMARLLDTAELDRFASGVAPVYDATARESPAPPKDLFAR